jgi:hypothetical protein
MFGFDFRQVQARLRRGLAATLLSQYPIPNGSGVILSLPHEALLMRLKVGDALHNLIALGYPPIHERHPVRFDDGARHRWFDANAFRKRHRFFDERIKIGFPIDHCDFPQRPKPILSGQDQYCHAAAGLGVWTSWK